MRLHTGDMKDPRRFGVTVQNLVELTPELCVSLRQTIICIKEGLLSTNDGIQSIRTRISGSAVNISV